MIILVTIITTSMNCEENKDLNPNAQKFTPYLPFEKATVYHLDDDADIGYLTRDADGEAYYFCISEANGKLLSTFCEVHCQFYGLHHATNVICTENYQFDDLMRAVKKNNIQNLHKILTELKSDDPEYVISCVMMQEWETGNTLLHKAQNEKMYAMIFELLSKDENKLLQAILKINWLNETPLFNAIQTNNYKMVNMLLTFVEIKASERLIHYVTHENNRRNTPLFISSRTPNPLIIDRLIDIITKYGSNPYFFIYHHLMHTNYQAKTILLYSRNKIFVKYVINIFLENNQNEKLMDLLMKQDYRQNTILTILIMKRDFNMVEKILNICKNINKEKLIKFVMLKDEYGGTILHDVVYTHIDHPQIDSTVETLFNIFNERTDLDALIQLITRSHNFYEIPLVEFIQQKYSFKIIWRYIKLMAIAPEEYLHVIDNVNVRLVLKLFANQQNLCFNNHNFSLKCALQDMVKQYETLNFFKVCNFVGKHKVLQIIALYRFKI